SVGGSSEGVRVAAIDWEAEMALARVVTFDGVTKERMEEMDREMREGQPPEGVAASEHVGLRDPETERWLVIVVFEPDVGLRRGAGATRADALRVHGALGAAGARRPLERAAGASDADHATGDERGAGAAGRAGLRGAPRRPGSRADHPHRAHRSGSPGARGLRSCRRPDRAGDAEGRSRLRADAAEGHPGRLRGAARRRSRASRVISGNLIYSLPSA